MSYFISDDFYKAGLPELFDIEKDFESAACDETLTDHEKSRAMNECLDRIDVLVDKTRVTEPEIAFLLVDEAGRFVSDNSGNMARGIVRSAFLDAAVDVICLQAYHLTRRLDRMSGEFEALLGSAPDAKL